MTDADREVFYHNIWLEDGGNNEDWTFGEKQAHPDYIFDGRSEHTEGLIPFLVGAIQRANS